MGLSIRCPKCSQISQVADAAAGSVFACQACGANLRVPAATSASAQPGQPPATTNPFEVPPGSPPQDSTSVYSAYASPPSVSDTAGDVAAVQSPPYVYQAAGGLVLTLTVLFVAHIVVDIAIGGMEVTQLVVDVDELGTIPLGDGESLALFHVAYGLLGLLGLPLSLLTAILFLVWVHRAHKNARALGAQGMQFTPGWCVGWFFVPIMNLFKPYQAIREIYQASAPELGPTDWKRTGSAGVVGLWWGLWLIGNFLGQIEFRLALRDDDVQASAALGAITSVLGVILCLVAMQLVRSLHRRQETKAGRNNPAQVA